MARVQEKERGRKGGEGEKKNGIALKKEKKTQKTTNPTESLRIQPAGLHCPNVHNALSLSVVLSHSHSLCRNPRCHRERRKNNNTKQERKRQER